LRLKNYFEKHYRQQISLNKSKMLKIAKKSIKGKKVEKVDFKIAQNYVKHA